MKKKIFILLVFISTFSVEAQENIKIQSITINGNVKTRSDIILREIVLKAPI